MYIYTFSQNALTFGKKPEPIKTNIEEYARIALGKGIFGILVKNPIKPDLFHLAEEQSGAIVGTGATAEKVVASVKEDIATTDIDTILAQIQVAKVECQGAREFELARFFGSIKN